MNDWQEAENHIERAHEHYQAGRWEEAEMSLREALSLNPYRPEWHFNLGLTLEACGKYSDAARAFKDCFELHEGDEQVCLAVGTNLLRAGEVRQSIEWFERAHAIEPTCLASLIRRIEAHTLIGEHDQAEVMFYMSQQLDPHNAEALLAMAESLLARGLMDKGVWCLREAATHDPSLPGVHSRLAHAYQATGRLERARQLYLRELRADPGDIDTLLDLGCLLIEMNRLNEASEKFHRVLELEPDNTEAHYHLASLAQRFGAAKTQEALEHFDVVLRLDPNYPGARRRLARLLQSVTDTRLRETTTQQVRDLLDAELELMKSRPELFKASDLEELVHVLIDANRAQDAQKILEELVARSPSELNARHLLAVCSFMLGQNERGIEVCREVLKMDPRFIPALHNLAVAYARMRQWRRARYWIRQGLRVDPDDAPLRKMRLKLRLSFVFEIAATGLLILKALNPLRPSRAPAI